MGKGKPYGCRGQSQTQSVIPALRPQARRRIRRCCPQSGAGERTCYHLFEQRSGPRHSQSLLQGFACCRRAVAATGRIYGQESLQVTTLLLLLFLLAGCGAHRRTETARVPPPPPSATSERSPRAPASI